ncbi:MAG: CDP-diacylglycerol--glycerol-3-phosphate 3-phosphatidyltransferase [Rhizobiales bacterium 65-9]|nr:CDP-diacylglycerol--glycerol-3-phosphate 3-phosphatidyltransferase [Hyphomicrobiales bacterium]OJY38532.1 MAG: CDP-diacylglycerol--glycerol-3-phosphate 3-phosphatidyltransferase [Rhizobiales bacterium 65-9]
MTLARPDAPPRRTNWPNVLTYARIAAVPAIVFCMEWPGATEFRLAALTLFFLAAVTDYFDGYLARAWGQQTTMGRMLDPIADKLLVSACLLMVVADGTVEGWWIWAAVIILCREILVSGLREFLVELRVSVPVSRIAKLKTTMQLIAIGFLIGAPVVERFVPQAEAIGRWLLVLAALLTLYTGFDYFKAGVVHLLDHDERR